MSNTSIIERIEDKLRELQSGFVSPGQFSEYLLPSIKAMEAILYAMVKEAQHFGYEIEAAEFADEQETLSDLDKVISKLKSYLERIRQLNP